MTSPNLQKQIVEMLLDKDFSEEKGGNKQWRIFSSPETTGKDSLWFVHETGKVRRGKSVAKSVAITPEARRMLGHWMVEKGIATEDDQPPSQPPQKTPKAKTKAASKSKAIKAGGIPDKINKTLSIMSALQRDDGATVEELMGVTGWQAHSVRGFLSTQKKKREDFALEKFTRGDSKTAYKIPTEGSGNG